MDREKLNKVSEEDARENSWYPGDTSYESDIIAMQGSFSDTFKRGANWLMQQPLSEKLTEEEKEKIRKLYKSEVNSMELENNRIKSAQSQIEQLCHESNFWQAKLKADMLESIFGADLFNDK